MVTYLKDDFGNHGHRYKENPTLFGAGFDLNILAETPRFELGLGVNPD
jgi:hypothetical protein